MRHKMICKWKGRAKMKTPRWVCGGYNPRKMVQRVEKIGGSGRARKRTHGENTTAEEEQR